VLVVDIDAEAGERLAKDLRDAGREASFFAADTAVRAGAEAAVAHVLEERGALDVLVNNAGWVRTAVATEVDDGDLVRMLDVYVVGYLNFARAALPHLVRSKGCIVNMSSMQAYRAIPGRAGVQAAKGAICSLGRLLALEYGPSGVRVNTVLPGFILTEKAKRDYAASATPEEMELRRLCYPLRRFGSPDDIAAAVAFLASAEASFITGVDLLVDGGISMQLAEAVVFPPFRRLLEEASPGAWRNSSDAADGATTAPIGGGS
jgi:NAD(P)-dependent dehydrogenase (short-subunit alcohol dehydrogenase family)